MHYDIKINIDLIYYKDKETFNKAIKNFFSNLKNFDEDNC